LSYHGYSPRGRKRNIGRNQIDPRGFTFSKVEVLKFIALSEDERYRQTLLEWERPRCCHCPFHSAAWVGAGAPLRRAVQDAMGEPVTAEVVKSVDEIPAVCLEDDLIAIFRLTSREMRLWLKFPEFIPFPPLPMLDRQIRVNGCVVAWFLAQDSSEYYRSFKSPLEELTKGKRGRSRPPWWKVRAAAW
jgi:hypothetical protein